MSAVPQLLKTPELASRLGISADSLLRAKDRCELNPIRIGRDLYWPEMEVLAWLESKRVHRRVVALHDRSSTTRRIA